MDPTKYEEHYQAYWQAANEEQRNQARYQALRQIQEEILQELENAFIAHSTTVITDQVKVLVRAHIDGSRSTQSMEDAEEIFYYIIGRLGSEAVSIIKGYWNKQPVPEEERRSQIYHTYYWFMTKHLAEILGHNPAEGILTNNREGTEEASEGIALESIKDEEAQQFLRTGSLFGRRTSSPTIEPSRRREKRPEDTPRSRVTLKEPTPEDNRIMALTDGLLKMQNALTGLINHTTPNKTLTIAQFNGKAEEVEAFVSGLQTAYTANNWTDQPLEQDTMEANRIYTLEEYFAIPRSQVFKAAQNLRGPAAIWWQNLQDKPFTLQDTTERLGRRPTPIRPGLPYVPRTEGLITHIRRTFRSVTHIADAKAKITNLKFIINGTKDIKAFAAELDALLIIIGIPYHETDDITNGFRAETLFKALPPWLESRIREQGVPNGCPHEQWCMGRIVQRASLILAAQAKNTSNTSKNPKSKAIETRKPEGNPSPVNRTWNRLPEEEFEKLKRQGVCFLCKQKGHRASECPKKKTNSFKPTINTLRQEEEEEGPVEFLSTMIENDWNSEPMEWQDLPWSDETSQPQEEFFSDEEDEEEEYSEPESGYRPLNKQEKKEFVKYVFEHQKCPNCLTRVYCSEHLCRCSDILRIETNLQEYLRKNAVRKPRPQETYTPPEHQNRKTDMQDWNCTEDHWQGRICNHQHNQDYLSPIRSATDKHWERFWKDLHCIGKNRFNVHRRIYEDQGKQYYWNEIVCPEDFYMVCKRLGCQDLELESYEPTEQDYNWIQECSIDEEKRRKRYLLQTNMSDQHVCDLERIERLMIYQLTQQQVKKLEQQKMIQESSSEPFHYQQLGTVRLNQEPEYLNNLKEDSQDLPVQKLNPNAKLPFHATPRAAGFDLAAAEEVIIQPGLAKKVTTGIAIKPPQGTYGQIAPVSSLTAKGINVIGGVIDEDYTGPYIVMLHNLTRRQQHITIGTKIAQVIFHKIEINLTPKWVDKLEETGRGSKGFGSTNKQFQEHQKLNKMQEDTDLLTLQGRIQGNPVKVMIDSGASGMYLNKETAKRLKIITSPTEAKKLIVADGTTQEINRKTHISLQMGNYLEELDLNIANIPQHEIILGKQWLQKNNPTIDWRTGTVTIKTSEETYILPRQKEPKVELVTAMQFKKDVKKARALFICLLKEDDNSNKGQTEDPELQKLLKEYQDVFPESLPIGPPPARNLVHRIQLIPGAEPPVVRIYPLSPKELQVLKEQLEELIRLEADKTQFITLWCTNFICAKERWNPTTVCRLSCPQQVDDQRSVPLTTNLRIASTIK